MKHGKGKQLARAEKRGAAEKTKASMNDDSDIDIIAMSWMTDTELDRYTDILQEVQEANAEWERFKAEQIDACPDMNTPITKEQRARYMQVMGRLESASQARNQMMHQVADRVGGKAHGWEKLLPLTLAAIESLANKGVTPGQAGGRKEFLKLVYSELINRHGKELATSPDFRFVQVMEFLLEPFSNRCPRLALEYRQRGELYLAQLLDELALDE